jgi:hypothetical protein
MSIRKGPWVTGLAGLLVAVGLPFAGHWARSRRGPDCALDGMPVEAVYRVEVVDGRGRSHAFCCLRCAQIWLDHQPAAPQSVTVTDEATGAPLDAAAAFYVRSEVVTTPTTGNRVHVFANRADARRHAEHNHGRVLSGPEAPLRR